MVSKTVAARATGALGRAPPPLIGLSRRSGQIAGAQQMYSVAQRPCPFGPSRESHTGLGGLERQAVPHHALGRLIASQHKMQVTERRP